MNRLRPFRVVNRAPRQSGNTLGPYSLPVRSQHSAPQLGSVAAFVAAMQRAGNAARDLSLVPLVFVSIREVAGFLFGLLLFCSHVI
jgi:hypothetical protein